MPIPLLPAAQPAAIASMADSSFRATTIQDTREAIRDGLHLGFLNPGSHDLPEPIFTNLPGRDIPEIRIDGMPVSPVRWPETSLMPVPSLAIGHVFLRRYSPIDGPLSSTGGPLIDVRLAPVPNRYAYSGIRVTRGSYGTFADDVVLRRPMGPVLLNGYYSGAKTNGIDLWGPQHRQAIGLRAGQNIAGGYGELGWDKDTDRAELLATKSSFWDRADYSFRWTRTDSTGRGVEGSIAHDVMDAGWRTLQGLTRRATRSVHLRVVGAEGDLVDRFSLAVEADVARTRFDRYTGERELLHDVSAGAAAGWTRETALWTTRLSGGIVRLSPLAPSPVFSAEIDRKGIAGPWLTLYASRAVRNRTLPRLPADGEAWVREGLGLADEKSGEQPEALNRAGAELRHTAGRFRLSGGADGEIDTRSFGQIATDLLLLEPDWQDQEIPVSMERRTRSFLSPWAALEASLPAGFRCGGAVHGAVAEGGVASQLALPALRYEGELGWRGAIFRGDLGVDLSLVGHGQTSIATPYGTLPIQGQIDGEIRGTIRSADLFFVLANLLDQLTASTTFDAGAFMVLPRRNYRAGLRWYFID